MLHPILCVSNWGFPPEVDPGLNLGKTTEVFHHHMGLKKSLKNQDTCKKYCAGMIYTSRTSSVLENNSIDQNLKEGIQINPGPGIKREPRWAGTIPSTLLVLLPGTAAFSPTMEQTFHARNGMEETKSIWALCNTMRLLLMGINSGIKNWGILTNWFCQLWSSFLFFRFLSLPLLPHIPLFP